MNTLMVKLGLALTLSLGVIAATHAADSDVIGQVGDVKLTEKDMREELSLPLYQLENQLYQLKSDWVSRKARSILFDKAAKEAGMSRQKWEARELVVTPPTETEIDEAIRRMVPPNKMPTDPAKLADVRKQAIQFLTNQRRTQKENDIYMKLSQKDRVQILVSAPPPPVIKVSANSAVKGPANAPVTIFEFTDFECPWCKKSQEQLKAVEQQFPGQIRFVDKMYPLNFHPRAMPAAEAAYCAKEQGKFWEFREKLFDSAPSLQDADFARIAKQVGLKQKKFDDCMSSHRTRPQIEADMAEGQAMGVRGTPSFFVNGTQTNFQQLSDAVRNELQKKR